MIRRGLPVATIVARRPHPGGEVHDCYHSARREKISVTERGRRGSGRSRVVSHDVHLDTADAVLHAVRQGPSVVAPWAFGFIMAAYGLVEELGVAAAEDAGLPSRRRGPTVRHISRWPGRPRSALPRSALLTELQDIGGGVVPVYSPQRAQRMLPLSTTQSPILAAFRAARFAPPVPATPSF